MPRPPPAKLPLIDPERIIVPLNPSPGVDFEERMVVCCVSPRRSERIQNTKTTMFLTPNISIL